VEPYIVVLHSCILAIFQKYRIFAQFFVIPFKPHPPKNALNQRYGSTSKECYKDWYLFITKPPCDTIEVVLKCWILAAQWEILKPQKKCVLMQVSAWSNKLYYVSLRSEFSSKLNTTSDTIAVRSSLRSWVSDTFSETSKNSPIATSLTTA
jgi:hypothetical protein